MMCAWNEFLNILPQWIRTKVNEIGRDELQELHLRINAPPEMVFRGKSIWLEKKTQKDDILFCINAASHFSPWTVQTASQGYITIRGGHRLGLCGEAIINEGKMCGFRQVHSVCIRIARDFTGIACSSGIDLGSFLILGAPGWGKTTLLRDFVRKIAENRNVSVIDERGELFPDGFIAGKKMDILTGCEKRYGIEMVLRTMAPEYIAVDEITAFEDAELLKNTAGCGVKLAATAHAQTIDELKKRPVYRELWDKCIFDSIMVLKKDQSYTIERITQCS